jgi:hypothetical protein
MAGVGDHGDIRSPAAHFFEQQGNLLVGQVETARHAAVVQHPALFFFVGDEGHKFRRREVLRAMAGKVHERRIAGAGGGQVFAESGDDIGAGGLFVDEFPDMTIAGYLVGKVLLQKFFNRVNVVLAAGQGANGAVRMVVVDADKKSMNSHELLIW